MVWNDEYDKIATWKKKEFDTDKLTGTTQRWVLMVGVAVGRIWSLWMKIVYVRSRPRASRACLRAWRLRWCPACTVQLFPIFRGTWHPRYETKFLRDALQTQIRAFHENLKTLKKNKEEAAIRLHDVNRQLRAKRRELVPLEKGVVTRTLEVRPAEP